MTRSKPRMAMEMSFVRIRRWWVSQSQPPLMVSSSTPRASRSCRSMASTFTAPKSFSSTQTLTPCPAHHAAYLRRKVVFPAPRNPVIKSTCTIFRPSVGFFFRCQYKRTRPDCQTQKRPFPDLGKGRSAAMLGVPYRNSTLPSSMWYIAPTTRRPVSSSMLWMHRLFSISCTLCRTLRQLAL